MVEIQFLCQWCQAEFIKFNFAVSLSFAGERSEVKILNFAGTVWPKDLLSMINFQLKELRIALKFYWFCSSIKSYQIRQAVFFSLAAAIDVWRPAIRMSPFV